MGEELGRDPTNGVCRAIPDERICVGKEWEEVREGGTCVFTDATKSHNGGCAYSPVGIAQAVHESGDFGFGPRTEIMEASGCPQPEVAIRGAQGVRDGGEEFRTLEAIWVDLSKSIVSSTVGRNVRVGERRQQEWDCRSGLGSDPLEDVSGAGAADSVGLAKAFCQHGQKQVRLRMELAKAPGGGERHPEVVVFERLYESGNYGSGVRTEVTSGGCSTSPDRWIAVSKSCREEAEAKGRHVCESLASAIAAIRMICGGEELCQFRYSVVSLVPEHSEGRDRCSSAVGFAVPESPASCSSEFLVEPVERSAERGETLGFAWGRFVANPGKKKGNRVGSDVPDCVGGLPQFRVRVFSSGCGVREYPGAQRATLVARFFVPKQKCSSYASKKQAAGGSQHPSAHPHARRVA